MQSAVTNRGQLLLTLGTYVEGLFYLVCVCVMSLHAAKSVYRTKKTYQVALH